ncbi:MAG: hypothetical protein Q7W16_09600 [Coriobacteriia bacterium]|nr:hypothetical protein [Coriobacteriia bacterium]
MATDKPVNTPDESAATPSDTPAATTAELASTVSATIDGALTASQCAFGSMDVTGDTVLRQSAIGMLSAKGSSTLERGCVGAVMAEGDVTVRQSAPGLIIGRRVEAEHSGSCVMVGSETEVRRGWVGLLLSRKTTLSEDSRVLFDWKAALILAAVMLGIFGIVLVIVFVLARRAMRTATELRSRLPHLPELPHLPDWVHALDRLRKSA